MILPYLPLSQVVEFDEWWLGPLDQFEGPWLSPDFESSARSLIATFRDVTGQRLERPSILVRSDSGADGVPPSPIEHQALLLAIGFTTIHQNPYWSANDDDGWRVATTDNAALWVQPVDVTEHRLTLGRGARVEIMAGGYRFDDEAFVIPAPFELHMPFAVTLDAELLHALYSVLKSPPDGYEHTAAQLRVAIRWFMKSWQNTPSITWEDRLVFVKVATEALSGEDNNVDSARKLIEILSGSLLQEGEGIGVDDLLWSPDEPLLTRTWGRPEALKSAEVSQFEHWACSLGDARNSIVHGEPASALEYGELDSPYNGPFVEIGDRVVRETITVLLGECGHPAVWRQTLARAGFKAYQALKARDPSQPDDGVRS